MIIVQQQLQVAAQDIEPTIWRIFFLHISGFWPMESKGWCFPYYGSILWTHNNENDSKNVFIGRNTISLLDRPRKDVIEEGNKPFIFFVCAFF